jgi:flagellar biosynthesis/type III secretory pathway chaperone
MNHEITIADQLQSQIETVKKLLENIRLQRQAIAENTVTDFEDASAEQQHLVINIEQNFNNFLQLLKTSGYQDSSGNITHFLESFPDKNSYHLVELWGNLQAITKECMEENQVNGRIINICKQQSEGTLQIMLGQSPQVELYDPSGKSTKNGTLPIGKA